MFWESQTSLSLVCGYTAHPPCKQNFLNVWVLRQVWLNDQTPKSIARCHKTISNQTIVDNRMMQVWRVSRRWEIPEKLEGVMGDYVERAAKRARRVALLTAVMHLDRIGCHNSLGRFFWCAAVLTSLVAAPSDLSSCTARLLQVVPGQTFQCSCSLRASRSRSVGIWDMSFAMRRTAARQRLKHWKPRSRASQAQNSWPEQCFSGLRLTICKCHQKRKKTRQTHGTNWTQPSAIGHVALTFSKFSTSSGSGKPSSSNQRSASATLLNRLSATFRRPEFPSPFATSQQAWRDRSKLQLFALLTRKKRWPFCIRIPQTLSASLTHRKHDGAEATKPRVLTLVYQKELDRFLHCLCWAAPSCHTESTRETPSYGWRAASSTPSRVEYHGGRVG